MGQTARNGIGPRSVNIFRHILKYDSSIPWENHEGINDDSQSFRYSLTKPSWVTRRQIYVRDVDEDVWWQIMQLEPLRISAIDMSYSDPFFVYCHSHISKRESMMAHKCGEEIKRNVPFRISWRQVSKTELVQAKDKSWRWHCNTVRWILTNGFARAHQVALATDID